MKSLWFVIMTVATPEKADRVLRRFLRMMLDDLESVPVRYHIREDPSPKCFKANCEVDLGECDWPTALLKVMEMGFKVSHEWRLKKLEDGWFIALADVIKVQAVESIQWTVVRPDVAMRNMEDDNDPLAID